MMPKVKVIPMGKRAFRLVDEENLKAFGFRYIKINKGVLIAVK